MVRILFFICAIILIIRNNHSVFVFLRKNNLMQEIKDFFIPAPKIPTEPWQIGNCIQNELQENALALIFCSDERGNGGDALQKNFDKFRNEFYQLSKLDISLNICDLGDLISGKEIEDTHYILEEILTTCLQKNTIPVLIGGDNSLAFTMFKAIRFRQSKVNYSQINNFIHLENPEGSITERNFLSKIFADKKAGLQHYHHLGYHRHLNDSASVNLLNDLNFETVRLAEMLNAPQNVEPFLRRADLATINCDAMETWAEAFSKHPQINGLNRREICAYMKEIGLGESLKSVGIFNFNFEAKSNLNYQLLAQMIWYLIEGIHIQKTHPKERQYETYIVMVEQLEYTFKRDTFSGLWYFGNSDDISQCLPCSEQDYHNAKKGFLARRFL